MHNKRILPAQNMLFPLPVVMASCGAEGHEPNIISLAWAGTLSSVPPIIGIGIHPARHSFSLVESSREFVINIPSASQKSLVTYCGTKSGRDINKFEALDLTPRQASKLKHAPLIMECSVNIECVVVNTVKLGSHTLFLGEVQAVQVAESVLNEDGHVDHRKVDPLAYAGSKYYSLGAVHSVRD